MLKATRGAVASFAVWLTHYLRQLIQQSLRRDHAIKNMARHLGFYLSLFISALIEVRANLSYRSDGPNVEIHSLRKMETTPFVMHDGTWYRDMLTIEASKAVANFANQYKPFRFPEEVSVFRRTFKAPLDFRVLDSWNTLGRLNIKTKSQTSAFVALIISVPTILGSGFLNGILCKYQ